MTEIVQAPEDHHAIGMSTDQRFLGVGAYISGSLYLMGCFVAGILFNVPTAWRLALIAAGGSFISCQLQAVRAPLTLMVVLSIAVNLIAVVAGLSLIWGIK